MPKPFHEIASYLDLPDNSWHIVDYLSVEYIYTYKGESRVAFNIKTRLSDKPERGDDDEDSPLYAVYRLSMEPSRWDHQGCVNFERQSNVVGYKPKDKNDPIPDFKPVADNSVAEFYLDLQRFARYSEHAKLTNTQIMVGGYISFRSLGTRLGPFEFHESKINPYKYYDSRDFM